MADQARIRLQDVTMVYETADADVHALDQVSFGVRDQEFVSLLGPSGCGKSTLLMLISGLLAPTAGCVYIDGKEIRSPYTDLGLVFQQDVLLDWRTVLDNVLLQIEMRYLSRRDYEERARELLRRTGLSDFVDRFPRELSGGMRQRVSICRALVHDPAMLLMDEPFGALDALTRDQMNLDLLRIWGQSRKTVVFVTHSIAEAVFLSDRILVMSKRPGRILEDIAVELPRPRKLAVRDLTEYSQYIGRVRDLLLDQGILVED